MVACSAFDNFLKTCKLYVIAWYGFKGERKIYAIDTQRQALCEFHVHIEPYLRARNNNVCNTKVFIFSHRHLFLMVSFSPKKNKIIHAVSMDTMSVPKGSLFHITSPLSCSNSHSGCFIKKISWQAVWRHFCVFREYFSNELIKQKLSHLSRLERQ